MSVKKTVIAFIVVLIFLLSNFSSGQASTPSSIADSWVTKEPMHEARIGLGVATVEGKIYAIGGNNGSYATGTNEEYDPVTNSWIYKSPMPTPRLFFAIAVFQNKIYCIGGDVPTNNPSGQTTTVNEVYDPSTDAWQTMAPMPTGRRAFEANVIGDKIYLIGGQVSDHNGTFLSVNEEFSPLTNSWKEKAPLPKADSSISAMAKNKIFVISSSLNQVYDPSNDSWSLGNPPPTLTPISCVGTTSGKFSSIRIYLFGTQTLSYDPMKDSWIKSASMPAPRYSSAAATVNDELYVIGGWMLSPAKDPSSQYPLYFQGQELYSPLNEKYTPLDYAAAFADLKITLLNPVENATYQSCNVPLEFSVNQPLKKLEYSLDGSQNVSLLGNTTLPALNKGLHNLTVYADCNDGSQVSSETITFSVSQSKDLSVVEQVSMAIIAVVSATLVVGIGYTIKRRHA